MGLDIVELVMAVEEKFGIEIEDVDAGKAETVGQLHSLVLRMMQQTTGTAPSADETWLVLCDLIEGQTGLPRSEITLEARLVGDLGID
jgi:acyl carrier protein